MANLTCNFDWAIAGIHRTLFLGVSVSVLQAEIEFMPQCSRLPVSTLEDIY